MVTVLPMLGMGQAVSILVGQRLGQDRPQIAERSTWNGFGLAWLYMGTVAIFYAFTPGAFLYFFQGEGTKAAGIAALVPVLLRFVAVYSLFDSMNLVFSFALRGAGDTRFVTILSLALSWPLMVVPTWAAWRYDWGLYWAWTFASAYVIALGITFLLRFRAGKWKSMRVIERAPVVTDTDRESRIEDGEVSVEPIAAD
jgi:MATE family multidrug resistance protein